jgi:hypothetical protein
MLLGDKARLLLLFAFAEEIGHPVAAGRCFGVGAGVPSPGGEKHKRGRGGAEHPFAQSFIHVANSYPTNQPLAA